MDNNEISTAEDFRRLAEANAFEAPEPLTLPSGLKIIAQRPKPVWWMLYRGSLPQTLAAEVSGNGDRPQLSDDEIVASSITMVKLFETMVIQPRIRRIPAPGEVDPAWISDEDTMFLVKYAGGEVAADGQDLQNFSGIDKSSAISPSSRSMENETVNVG